LSRGVSTEIITERNLTDLCTIGQEDRETDPQVKKKLTNRRVFLNFNSETKGERKWRDLSITPHTTSKPREKKSQSNTFIGRGKKKGHHRVAPICRRREIIRGGTSMCFAALKKGFYRRNQRATTSPKDRTLANAGGEALNVKIQHPGGKTRTQCSEKKLKKNRI